MKDVRHTVSRLTPAGAGAVAVLQLEGPPSILDDAPILFRAANGRPVMKQRLNRLCYGQWGTDSPESVVLCRVGPETTEIQCHGGRAAVARIISDLESRGCVAVDASHLSGSMEDLIETECRDALTRATTLRTADLLLQQQTLLPRYLGELNELPPDDAKRRVEELLRWADFGLHLTHPWQVVLCGRPNVGKSSLINTLVGYARSIVFDQPGTTRDVVSVETAFDGWPIAFSDTAGIREQPDELEAEGIRRARHRLKEADLRIVLIDVSQSPTEEDFKLLDEWGDVLVVAHKCDLEDVWGRAKPQAAIMVSSKSGAGVNELVERIVQKLIPIVPEPMTPMPVTRRQVEALTLR
ncbi:MAG: 50S ribosome-binding GTPase [Planctomycetaceae bacterium]|nr:50S ribosome-binding GTPase [Planctomycetaceae bacterium]